MWAMKALLRGFEMVSGLRINLNKIKIYGIFISSYFMEVTSHFLGCKIDKFPFEFLGFSVGGNHRNACFWILVINSMKYKLSSWEGTFLSIEGRITMLNNVLSNLPNYQLPFFKVPLKVVKEIREIQRKFL